MRTPRDTVAGAFLHSAAQFSDRGALLVPGEAPRSYATLQDDVARAIATLRELGCRPGDRIALWLPNRPEWATLTYAAALLGLCVVPVNARLRPAELVHVLRLARPRVLFTQEHFLGNHFLERLEEAERCAESDAARPDEASIRPPHVVLVEGRPPPGTLAWSELLRPAVSGQVMQALAAQRQPREPLWLFFTSGTTRAPKGVLLAQCAIADVAHWTTMAGYRADDRVLMTRPLFYVAGHFWCLLGPMVHGATAVVGQRFTADEIVALCRSERITVLSGNPLLLRQLVDDPAFDAAAFAQVRIGYFGGSAIDAASLLRIRARIPYRALLHVYGATELGGFATSTRPEDPPAVAHASCGVPLPGAELRLVDPATGAPCRTGETGTLLARSASFIDYVGITPDERGMLLTADGWIRTGDLLRRRGDGRYEFVGRAKDLIKVGGENVAAAEIERVIATHPQVARVAVLGVPDEARGEVPFAFVELARDAAMHAEDLREWCRARMAPFKLPRHIAFVAADAWPVTATGKLAQHELAAMAAEARDAAR